MSLEKMVLLKRCWCLGWSLVWDAGLFRFFHTAFASYSVAFLSKSVILHSTVQLPSLKFIAQLNELTLLYFFFFYFDKLLISGMTDFRLVCLLAVTCVFAVLQILCVNFWTAPGEAPAGQVLFFCPLRLNLMLQMYSPSSRAPTGSSLDG